MAALITGHPTAPFLTRIRCDSSWCYCHRAYTGCLRKGLNTKEPQIITNMALHRLHRVMRGCNLIYYLEIGDTLIRNSDLYATLM